MKKRIEELEERVREQSQLLAFLEKTLTEKEAELAQCRAERQDSRAKGELTTVRLLDEWLNGKSGEKQN